MRVQKFDAASNCEKLFCDVLRVKMTSSSSRSIFRIGSRFVSFGISRTAITCRSVALYWPSPVRGNQITHDESRRAASLLGFAAGRAVDTCALNSLSGAPAIVWEARGWIENIAAAAIAAVTRTIGTASLDGCTCRLQIGYISKQTRDAELSHSAP